jgi:MtN3 and saliva related transmembrane protein
MNLEIIGWIASMVNAVILIPQAYDSLKTKKLRDVSLTTSLLNFINSILWLIYGIYLNNGPLILTNFIQLILSGLILFLKLKYNRKK